MIRRRRDARGQALVEFAFAIIVFLMLFIGMIDIGRGVFMFNGVASAAREIARETSVYPGDAGIGASAESVAMYATQRALVPGLTAPTYECLDISGSLVVDGCQPGDWVRVTTTTTFQPAVPFLVPLGPLVLTSSSSAEIQ